MRREFEYIFENLKIGFKSVIEFKVNLYSIILLSISHALIPLFFGYIIIENFGDVINWTFRDFFVFYFFQNVFYLLVSQILWKNMLKSLTSGDFQMFVNKPIHSMIMYLFYNRRHTPLIYLVIDFIVIFPILILYFQISIFYFMVALLFGILFSSLTISFFLVIITIHFYSYHFAAELMGSLKRGVNFFRNYPGVFFEKFQGYQLFFVMVSFAVSFFCVDIIKYQELPNMSLIVISSSMFLIVIFTIISILLWNKGLKKYEAFS